MNERFPLPRREASRQLRPGEKLGEDVHFVFLFAASFVVQLETGYQAAPHLQQVFS
tara:strand:- start:172 stop:339 length:168 start_codon:yes stop_codon:yes gene_type:complete